MTTALLVGLGAALGAPARYLTDRLIQDRFGSGWPWGTFTVNVVGSFIFGLVAAATAHGLDPRVSSAVGVGFCGALTTYSAFGYETLRLAESGTTLRAVGNVAGSVGAGLAAAALGWAVGSVLR